MEKSWNLKVQKEYENPGPMFGTSLYPPAADGHDQICDVTANLTSLHSCLKHSTGVCGCVCGCVWIAVKLRNFLRYICKPMIFGKARSVRAKRGL